MFYKFQTGFLLLFCATFCSKIVVGQNLIPNPGFEIFSSCPNGYMQINRATGWATPSSHSGSADYFNVCGSSGVGIPNNTWGPQASHSGNGYMGFGIYYGVNPEFREYMQIALVSPLTVGITYNISFYVSCADVAGLAADGLQAYFSNGPVAGTGSWNSLPFVPQFSQAPGVCITDKTNWTLVSGSFTANGNENYMTFGNFKNDLNTVTVSAGAGAYPTLSYYFIDDFTLTAGSPLASDLGKLSATRLGKQEVKLLWQGTESTLNSSIEIERSIEGSRFHSLSVFDGNSSAINLIDSSAPDNQTLFYRPKISDRDGNTLFGNTVMVLSKESKTIDVSVFPNPLSGNGNHSFLEILSNEPQDANLVITDESGKAIFLHELELESGQNKFTLPKLGKGMFFLKISTQEGTSFLKWIVLNQD